DELVLQDIDGERLEVVGGLAKRILDRHEWPGRLVVTKDRDRALDGASFVIVQLRVGGQAARLVDETLPLEFGCIGQETTGPGGFAKALRTVPVVLDIAEETERRGAPGAWLIDFTNPVGIVMQALLDHGHRAIGLCNSAMGFQRKFAQLLDVGPERVSLDHVGLNHLTWERAVYVDGEDRLPELIQRAASEAAAQLIASLQADTGDQQVVDIRNDGALPDLPDDAVVEIPARVGAGGAQADSLAALAPEMLGLVQQIKAYERLAVRAAVDGDRAAALKALLANPLVGQYKIAKPLLNALLEANRAHLPRFFKDSMGFLTRAPDVVKVSVRNSS